MLQNYFKIALRNLYRNKVYTAINITGLAVGIASCILIFLFIQDELNYESHFTRSDRIVRIASELNTDAGQDRIVITPAALAPALVADFPDVEHVTQLARPGLQTLWIEEKSYNVDDLLFADSVFFKIFDYEIVAGDIETMLDKPKTLVLSETLAEKLFGDSQQAMGQMVTFSNGPYVVTGVYRDKGHSHIKASGFMSRSTLDAVLPEDIRLRHWFALNRFTYVQLPSEDQIPAFQEKLHTFSERRVNPWLEENRLSGAMQFIVIPLKEIHFDTVFSNEFDLSPSGNPAYIYIFGLVALFVLLIACINYMNLATARSSKRAKEVGLRKVVGAYRSQIIGQFIGESLLITFVAVVLALALTQILIPTFNELTGKQFGANFFVQPMVLLALAGIIIFVGVVAGSYPAFFLSGFKPAEVLKSDKSPKGGSATLRRGLVILQFTISLILIIGTIVVFSQMNYLRNRDLGFNKEQIMVIDIPGGDSTLVKRLPTIKQQLLANPNIELVSNTRDIPANILSKLLMLVEAEDKMREKTTDMMFVDYDFLDLMGIELKEGRNFSKATGTDLKGALIINETAARKFGWQNPIGKRIQVDDWDAKVIGVIKDFHVRSLHTEMEPLVIALTPVSPGYLLARLKPDNMQATIGFVEEKWQAFDPKHPMEYFFLDEHFDEQYRAEEKMLTVFGYFAGLTIFIACLGLFGLASFTTEQRTKEIGIRKVLGSSTSSIVLLISKDFALLVFVAILLAVPVAWYGMDKWLQDFAYRTELSWWIFASAGAAAMIIALLTVSLQAVKAALQDPVKAIRTQ